MYRTILVPIDLSQVEKDKVMIDTAKKFAGKGTRIKLINVMENIPGYIAVELPGELINNMKENANRELEGLAKAAGISSGVEIRSGKPATAILEAANYLDADLIIMASHQPEFQDYLLGSTAARVVRHAQCSVLVIR